MNARTVQVEPLSPKKKKVKKPKSSGKRSKNPNKIRGTAYRMRYDKHGTVWHSIIDIDRPNSPEVEWPEYKNMRVKADFPKEEFMSGDIDPGVDELLTKAGFVTPGYKPMGGGMAPEIPEEMEEVMESVDMPQIPGLYPGGAGGDDDDDDYDDYADGYPTALGGWDEADDGYDE